VLRKVFILGLVPLLTLFIATSAAQSHHRAPSPYAVVGFLGDDTDQCFFNLDGEQPTADFNAYGSTYTERFANHHHETLEDIGLACVGRSAPGIAGHEEGPGGHVVKMPRF
jgi:hypothetical protein